MLGLGLSLLGGAVMEDADGARAYFPAAAVRCNNAAGSTAVVLQAFSQTPVAPAAWNTENMSGAFSCRVLKRAAERWSGWSFGCYSSYNNSTGNADYFFYSGILLHLAGEHNGTYTGNRSVLHYAAANTPYSTGSTARVWEKVINSFSPGGLHFQVNGAALTGNAFGTAVESILPAMRVDAVHAPYSNLRLFGALNLDVDFYGSCWRDRYLNGAWQCLPMQSANGSAALFETTTQQLVEHESLSTAA